MPIPETLRPQLYLSYEILYGLHPPAYTPEELVLMKLDPTLIGQEADVQVRRAAIDVLVEKDMAILAEIFKDDPLKAVKAATLDLLERIEKEGGVLRRRYVGVDDALLSQLVESNIVIRLTNGLAWGPMARQAIREAREDLS